jgi:signal transduction histidine kinase
VVKREEAMQETNADQHLETVSLHEHSQDNRDRYRDTRRALLWLHSPWWGYLCSLLLVGTLLLLDKIDPYLPGAPLFIGTPFALVSVVVGLIWGVAPALFAIMLGVFAIAEFISPGIFTLNIGQDILVDGPFIALQLVAVMIAFRFESSQRHLLTAQRETQAYAQELEATNQALAQANRLKDHFITRASHELRTPLTTIQGQAQLALRRLNKQQATAIEPQSVQKPFENIAKKAGYMKVLIDDLMILSGLHSETMPLHLSSCDFKNVCYEAIEDQREFSDRPFELQFPSDPMIIQADYGRFLQVVTNLVENAVKYSPENSTIHMGMCQEDSRVILQVHNSGPALSQEQQRRLFEPFYRTSDAEDSSIPGWGLGLAICKEIVERHSGQIYVQSSEEEGTTFFVQLQISSF